MRATIQRQWGRVRSRRDAFSSMKKKKKENFKLFHIVPACALFSLSLPLFKVTERLTANISLHESGGHAKASLFRKSVKNCHPEAAHRGTRNPKLSCTMLVLKGLTAKFSRTISSREMTATARCKWSDGGGIRGSRSAAGIHSVHPVSGVVSAGGKKEADAKP